MADVLAQHAGVRKARADERSVNLPAHQILTGRSHHAQLGVFAHDVAVGAGNRFFGQRGADVQHTRTLGHEG